MTTTRYARFALAIFFAAALCGLVLAGSRSAAAPDELLPDIVPGAPKGLTVQPNGSGGYQLGFDAAFVNEGSGPLRIEGRGEDASERRMVAVQAIDRSDGSTETKEGVGDIRFVESEDHRHWHFLGFMRYELVRPSDGEVVAPDQKTGFCVLDLYDADASVRLPGEPLSPGVFDPPPGQDFCGLDDPERTSLTMGLSVGYADRYRAFLDGQAVDLTDVPEGRYRLVHRVEAVLLESDHENNAASVLLELRWPGGPEEPPTVEVLESCPDAARCPSG